MVRTGLQRIADDDETVLERLRGKRLGLLAHPASVDRALRHAAEVLQQAGCELKALFGPEHGYGGEAQDMVAVESEQAAMPIYSLYGSSLEDLSPRPEWLQGLDAVVIDLQDVGSRYYTYVWTAALMMKVAAAQGVQTIVLDRPNPLGCLVVEGAPQRPGYRSFVGLHDLPVRHGLTIGEICRLVQLEEQLPEDCLWVVTMTGYTRSLHYAECGVPWVPPSPNMPTLDTALVYPGGCLLEGTNLSEGRGTTRPFEMLGAPFIDGKALSAAVEDSAAGLRPISFLPMFQKHGRVRCHGVQVHVMDVPQLRSYNLYLRIIAAAFAQSSQARFRTEAYEFVADRPAIDLLTGGPEFRQHVELRKDISALLQDNDEKARAFQEATTHVHLY